MSGLKALLTGGQVVAYYPALARAVGGIAPALFLQQIAHWSGYSDDEWVFRTQEQLEEELAMSAKVQARCRASLEENGFLEIKREGWPARLYFKIEWDKVEAALQLPPSVVTTKGHDKLSPSGTTIYKSSNKNSRRDADASPEQNKDAEKAPKPNHIKNLVEGLRLQEFSLSTEDKGKYAGHVAQMRKAGASEAMIARAIARLVADWHKYPHSSLQKASSFAEGNVTQLRASKKKSSPDCVIRALEEYELNGNTEMRRFAPLAREYDFGSAGDPPWPILAKLGGNDEERFSNLKRIRSIAKRAVREAS